MLRLSLFTLLLFACSAQAGVYRWVDADGQVHFSDRPQAGAEEVELQDAQTFSAPPAPRTTRRTGNESSESEQSFRYESVAITSPSQEEVLWNIEGELTVSIQPEPRLQPGHRIRLILDGDSNELTEGSTRARLTGVSRGSHSLRAEILDPSGTSLAISPTVQFAVQQTSVQNPNNPNVPPRPTPRPRPR